MHSRRAYSPKCLELDFSHLAVPYTASVRRSTKSLATFCVSLRESDTQKVALQRTCSCWKVRSEKRGARDQKPYSSASVGGRHLDHRFCFSWGERDIYHTCSQMAKVEL
jgi:hypothetical protein